MVIFCSFTPKRPRKSKFWKMRKFAGDYYFANVYKNYNHMMYSSWDTEWDRQNFLSFWTIFCPFSLLTIQKIKILKLKKTPGDIIIYTFSLKMTIIWCMVPEIWSATDRVFCHFGAFFALLSPYGPRELKFWKMKKIPEDIIILQMCTINDSYMMYSSWDMKCNALNFLSYWTMFCSFTPLTTQKIKLLKNWKKCLEILSFYACVP